jgi:hypothetical protein
VTGFVAVPAPNKGNVTVSCDEGDLVLSGGYSGTRGDIVSVSRPTMTLDGWTVSVDTSLLPIPSGTLFMVSAYALCMDVTA